MNFIRNRNFRAGPQTSLEGFICHQNSDKQQKIKVFGRSGGGVLLNAKKIGNYCGFNAGSLVGNKDSQENRPEIGDYVAFGPGAKAFGKITIGDNVFVASNAVVVKDIPSNVIVGGLPAKIIKEKQNGKTK